MLCFCFGFRLDGGGEGGEGGDRGSDGDGDEIEMERAAHFTAPRVTQ